MASPSEGNMSGRRSTLILVCALALSACSESSLSDLGGRSSEWIGTNESASVDGPAVAQQPVVRSVEVDWVNDQLGSAASIGSPQEVLAALAKSGRLR